MKNNANSLLNFACRMQAGLIAKLVAVLCKQADGVLFVGRKKKKRTGTVYIWQPLVFVGGLWPNPDGDVCFLLYARK